MAKRKSEPKTFHAIQSDAQLREDIRNFMEPAVKAVEVVVSPALSDLYNDDVRLSEGFTRRLLMNEDLSTRLRDLCKRLEVDFGPLRAHRDGIRRCLEAVIFAVSDGHVQRDSMVPEVLARINKEVEAEYTYVAPSAPLGIEPRNAKLELPGITIGTPASLDLLKEGHLFWRDPMLGEDWQPDAKSEEVVWMVTLKGMQENVEVEARWLANVTMSFLIDRGVVRPSWIAPLNLEPAPFGPCYRIPSGTRRPFSFYQLQVELTEPRVWETPDFKKKAEGIFRPAPGSVGQHVRQSLGWLSRARQSTDGAERLLYAFTAIEALLAPQKDQPITQTIARQSAVLAVDKVQDRSAFAKRLRELYARRSSLVHEGSRAIPGGDQDAAYSYAAGVVSRVVASVPLDMLHETFRTKLEDASYGQTLAAMLSPPAPPPPTA